MSVLNKNSLRIPIVNHCNGLRMSENRIFILWIVYMGFIVLVLLFIGLMSGFIELSDICEATILKDAKDYCYFLSSKIKNDIGYCRAIENEFYRDECYLSFAKLMNNLSICNLIQMRLKKDECYRDIAITNGDYRICKEIGYYLYRDFCYFRIAIRDNNSELCHNILDENLKKRCHEELS